MKNSLGGIPVTRAMMTDFRTLSPGDSLTKVVAYILAGSQHDFPVMDANGRVAGVLERDDFMKARLNVFIGTLKTLDVLLGLK